MASGKELTAAVLLQLKDNFSQGMVKAANASEQYAGKTIGALNKVDKAFSGTIAKIGALGVTLSLGAAAKSIIQLDHRMTRLGLTANASAEQVSKMKQAIFDGAQSSDIKLDPTNILAGLEVVMTKTGDLQYAEANIRNIALAIQASGESGDAIGDVFAEFKKLGFDAGQISVLMDDMVAQSDKGEFTFAEFAKNAKGVISAYRAIGESPDDIKRANAAMQVLTAGTKSSEVATTVLNSAINELRDPKKRKELEKLGIKVRNDIDPKKLRDFNEIMSDLAVASNDLRKADIINSLFGSETLKAVSAYNSEFGRNYSQLLELGDTAGLLQGKAATMAGTLQSNLQNLQTAFVRFADSNLTKPLEHITNLLNKMAEDPKRFEAVFNAIKRGVLIIGGLKIGAGVMSFLGAIRDFQKGSGNVNITETLNAGGANAGGMPVYVTNWGGAASGPIGAAGLSGARTGGLVDQYGNPLSSPGANPARPDTPAPSAPKSKWKLNKPNMKGALKAGAGAAAVTAALTIPGMIGELKDISKNEELTREERGKAKGGAVGDAVGSIGGAAAGAIAGAAIGSVVPVVGTALGALVGGLVGQFGGPVGRFIGEKIGAAVSKEKTETTTEDEKKKRAYEELVNTRAKEYSRWTAQSRSTQTADTSDAVMAVRQRPGQYLTPAAELPPQITQTGTGLAPLKAELAGQAAIDVNVNLSGERPTAQVNVKNNNIRNMRFNTGHAPSAREYTS